MKRNACQKCAFAVRDDNPHCGLRGFRSDFNVEWCESENDKAPNGYELQEDGYFSWLNKKEYPKTYEECCRVLGLNSEITDSELLFYYPLKCGDYTTIRLPEMEKFEKFIQLYLCRNAYWKIYGEENGLGKPWEPDYSGTFEHGTPIKYVIYNIGTHIVKERKSSPNHILSFPSAEMRDAFYENFKSEIEFCKELL